MKETLYCLQCKIWIISSGQKGFIGLTDAAEEGTYLWLSGSSGIVSFPSVSEDKKKPGYKTCFIAATYSNFRCGEPNNAGGDEDCANMWEDGGWNDAMCDSADRQFQYLCEIESKFILQVVLLSQFSLLCSASIENMIALTDSDYEQDNVWLHSWYLVVLRQAWSEISLPLSQTIETQRWPQLSPLIFSTFLLQTSWHTLQTSDLQKTLHFATLSALSFRHLLQPFFHQLTLNWQLKIAFKIQISKQHLWHLNVRNPMIHATLLFKLPNVSFSSLSRGLWVQFWKLLHACDHPSYRKCCSVWLWGWWWKPGHYQWWSGKCLCQGTIRVSCSCLETAIFGRLFFDFFAWENFSHFSGQKGFIGLNDQETEGTYVWLSGSSCK